MKTRHTLSAALMLLALAACSKQEAAAPAAAPTAAPTHRTRRHPDG
jgi:uncharacterized lipoprotein YbaY